MPTEAPAGKIEVTEFFFYTCPHCADMEPLLEKWAKTLPKDVSLRRVPVLFRPQLAPFRQDLLHAGSDEPARQAARLRFSSPSTSSASISRDEKTLFGWVASKGVDAAKFEEIYKSFAVASKVTRADQITRAYNIPGHAGHRRERQVPCRPGRPRPPVADRRTS